MKGKKMNDSEMRKSALTLLNPGLKTLYCVPTYQRGYRWGKREITALLEDLYNFMKKNGENYLLQPVVVKTITDIPGNTEKYGCCKVLVDGQQRLTTLRLIFEELQIPLNCKFWDITAKKYVDDLHDLSAQTRQQAKTIIASWLQDEDHRKKLTFLLSDGYVSKHVFLIEYELPAEDDEHQAFLRLNAGKIPLTSAELIRALLMTSNLTDERKMEIAKEWELFENFLRENQTRRMISHEESFSVQLDRIFGALAQANDTMIPLHIYQKLEPEILDDPVSFWKKVLQFFDLLKSCRQDSTIYNGMGYLSSVRGFNLADFWKSNNPKQGINCKAIKHYLRKKIKNCFGENPDWSSIRYHSPDAKKYLLLLNVLFCSNNRQYFDFEGYSAISWDIKHIDSQTENDLKDPAEQEEWLRLAYAEMKEEDKKTCNSYSTFAQKREFIAGKFNDQKIFDKDGIGNLVLLDSHINRGYKNAIFPVKRRWIIDASVNGKSLILPCTLAAFMKFYDLEPEIMNQWTKKNADSYANAMNQLIDNFFNEEE